MNMQIRGIRSVRADLDPKAVLTDLTKAFQEFKSEQDERLNRLENFAARGEFRTGGEPSGPQNTVSMKEHEKAFFAFVRKGVDSGLNDLEVKAALKTVSDPDGGYAVPLQIDRDIEKLETDSVAMRRVAKIKQITTSDYRKLVSVGGTISGWVSELATRPETGTPSLKAIVPTIGELYANPAVTQTALDDMGFDVAEWLAEEIANEFADQEGAAFVNGNGVGKPKGILAYSTSSDKDSARDWGVLQHVAGGAASAFTDPDKLIDIVHELRAKYRKGAAWLMNSKTIATVRKFRDGEGEYIWRDNLEMGAPNTLLGYPVEEDENMPDIGTNSYPIAFGNFKRGYLIVDRVGVRVLRDPLTNKPFVHFYTTKRVGGAVQNFEAIKLLKVATS